MSQPLQPFRALQLAEDLIAALPDVLAHVAKHDRSLADQLRRAAQSVLLNLAEAGGHTGGNRRLRFQSAYGSVRETLAALHIARCWRYANAAQIETAEKVAHDVARVCWRLLNPQ